MKFLRNEVDGVSLNISTTSEVCLISAEGKKNFVNFIWIFVYLWVERHFVYYYKLADTVLVHLKNSF